MSVERGTSAVADLFAGTADYYARYRPPYPAELIAHVTAHAAPGQPRRVLDLGCGTGELAIPLSEEFAEIVAVDAAADMIACGRRKAERAGRGGISWVVRTAEAFTAAEHHFCLVTAGASFHWMDRHEIAGRALRWLRPGGAIAVAGVNSTWNGDEEWQRLVVEVIQRWLGPTRRAGSGTFAVSRERHEDVLAAAGFAPVTDTTFATEYTWDVERFLGYLYSTSFASKAVLGDRADDFEADVRATLLGYDPRGTYTETLRFHVLIGSVPR